MSALRRAFLAVVPPPPARAWTDAAVHAAASVVSDLRWTRSEQRHLTLQFLGPVDDPAAVAEFVADAARARQPFTLSLGGGGAFPNPRRASVLWVGVRQGSGELTDLAENLSPLSGDDRPYRAHLTLARVSKARDVRPLVAALDACRDSDPWTVDEIVLFDSEPSAQKGRPGGAVHTEVARFRLAG
jgi:2'-5' RNA ligase